VTKSFVLAAFMLVVVKE